jgi:putative Holliday junction resolvase
VGRILGLDYGRKRVGVSVSDPLGLTAQPVETWKGLRCEDVVEKTRILVETMGVERVVVGFPLTLKGKRGHLAREVVRFSAELKRRIRVPITLWDERLTSVQARAVLHQMEEKPSRKKERVDLIASVLLLQNYLDHREETSARNQKEED